MASHLIQTLLILVIRSGKQKTISRSYPESDGEKLIEYQRELLAELLKKIG